MRYNIPMKASERMRECKLHGPTLHRNYKNGPSYYPRCLKCLIGHTNCQRRKKKLTLAKEHGGACQRCGHNSIYNLDFHHRDRSTKEFQISARIYLALDTLRKEANKCDLLCVNCHREVENELRAAHMYYGNNRTSYCRRQELIQITGGSCSICMYNTYTGALEFHHLDPTRKDFTISTTNALSQSKLTVYLEASKCVLLCANCHRDVTIGGQVISQKIIQIQQNKWEEILTQMYAPAPPRFKCQDCSKPRKYKALRCQDCSYINQRKVQRPSKETLLDLIVEQGYKATGRQFGVADNTVRKWLRTIK